MPRRRRSSHRAVYNQYKDESNLKVTINGVESVINTDGVTYTSKMTFTITNKDGSPYSDLAGLDQKRYIANKYDSATRQFITPEITYANPTSTGTAGQFSVTSATATFAPETSNAQAYVYVADGALASEGMTLYSDVSNAGLAFGDVGTYESTANVAACEKCHGTPYLKHGYRAAKVAGLPDFAACKACHLDDKAGGHQGWQLLYDPAAYAAQNGVLTDARRRSTALQALRHERHAHVARDGVRLPAVDGELRDLPRGQARRRPDGCQLHADDLQELHPVTGSVGVRGREARTLAEEGPAR